MPDNNLNKRLARNTTFLYIRMVVVMVISLYTTRVILRVLGTEDYGIYNVVCGFVSMFQVLNTCLNTGTNRFYNFALGKNDIDSFVKVYNASLFIQVIIAVIAVLLIESIGLWYINNVMVIPDNRISVANWIFQYAVLSLLFLILSTPYSAAILAHERMDYYAIVSIVDVLLRLAFVIILQFVPIDKLLFYGLLMTFVSILNFLMYNVYSRRNLEGVRISLPIDRKIFKELMSFSGWSILDPITMTTKGQGSNMVLNLFFGTIVNAAYGVANQISVAINSFTQNISVAFRPQIIQSYASGEYGRTKKLMFSMSKLNYIFHTMLIIPIIMELDNILFLWLGEGYPQHVIPFATCVLIITNLDCLHAPISMIMVATGKIKVIKTGSLLIISSVIPLGIFVFSIGFPPTTIFLLLIGLTIVNIVFSVIIMTRTFTELKIKEYIISVFWPCFIYTILVFIFPLLICFILPSSFARFILLCVVSFISSVLIGYKMISDYERTLLKGYVSTIIQKLYKYR